MEFIASGKSIHAHKFILSLRCEYFKTMFSGDWQESRDGLVNWFAVHSTPLILFMDYYIE